MTETEWNQEILPTIARLWPKADEGFEHQLDVWFKCLNQFAVSDVITALERVYADSDRWTPVLSHVRRELRRLNGSLPTGMWAGAGKSPVTTQREFLRNAKPGDGRVAFRFANNSRGMYPIIERWEPPKFSDETRDEDAAWIIVQDRFVDTYAADGPFARGTIAEWSKWQWAREQAGCDAVTIARRGWSDENERLYREWHCREEQLFNAERCAHSGPELQLVR